jgi:hypothetical protein
MSQIGDRGRFHQAADAIDAYNREDPRGRELEYSDAVVDWIMSLRPEASEALLLAGRAHHIGRWQLPRDSYPRDRAGYLRWRRDLQALHADEAAHILVDCGYPLPFVDRVRSIIQKERLREDAEVQTLEDALCLVFIERQLAGFQHQHDEAKLKRIIRRTWSKMSPAGREAALRLPVSDEVRRLLERCVGASDSGGR